MNSSMLSVLGMKEVMIVKIEYGLDRYCLPTQIHIVPSKNEDIDMLHNAACRLLIENPAIDFSKAAKAGLLDKYNDDQYDAMLSVIKRLNLLFIPPKEDKSGPVINIFDLLVQLLYEYMLNQHSEVSRIL